MDPGSIPGGSSAIKHERAKGKDLRMMDGEAEQLYYIQNRETVGNCLSWWGKKGNGYTCDISKAETYTLVQAKEATRRSIDRFWPKEYIDSIAVRHVDHQDTDCNKSMRAGIYY